MKLSDVPKNYKVRVENDIGAFKLAGRIIRSFLEPIKFRSQDKLENRNTYIAKKFNYIRERQMDRLRFIKTQPLLRHWCDISGYSYTKVRDKIERYNKTLTL